MPPKKQNDAEYETLRKDLSDGSLKNLYILHGEERYLLEHYLGEIRNLLGSGDFAEFNHKRFEGRGLNIDELISAVDALPVFAERTFIEVHDFDIFKSGEEALRRLVELFSDLPEYVCLIFIYSTIDFKLDNRMKIASEIKKAACIVEFKTQEQARLIKWIQNHCSAFDKKIDVRTAEYLAFITGCSMTALHGEISKLCAYCTEDSIARIHIDAVVTPVLDAVSYKLADAVAKSDFADALQILDELFRMREPAHRLMFGIGLKMRQMMAARLCVDRGLGVRELMDMCGIRYDFQARNLISSARNIPFSQCKNAVLLCSQTAYAMNSGYGDPESLLKDLLFSLSAAPVEKR